MIKIDNQSRCVIKSSKPHCNDIKELTKPIKSPMMQES